MEPVEQFKVLGIALVLGLLVGLQREVSQRRPAGFRTFPLITVFGTLCSLLGMKFGPWIPALGFAGILVLVVLVNVIALRSNEADTGLTSEVAVLLMYAVGAYLPVGAPEVAVVIGGVAAILLHLKPEMHSLASRLERTDLKAIMQFVLVSFVILPLVPNQTFGPFDVLNPFVAWLMVVLIVGISLTAYLTYKLLGSRAGILAGGILGGFVSSTATTVSYSRAARTAGDVVAAAGLVIVIASTIASVRVLVLIAFVDSLLFKTLALPIALMFMFPAVFCLFEWRRVRNSSIAGPSQRNPTELRTAFMFAAVYSVVLVVVAAAKDYAGQGGLYAVSAITGLTDLDAISLSTAQLAASGRLDGRIAAELIVVAVISNTLVKAVLATVLGGRVLGRRILLPLLVPVLAGLAALLFLL